MFMFNDHQGGHIKFTGIHIYPLNTAHIQRDQLVT